MSDRSASMAEFAAIRVPHGHYDVAVLGGGLGGLSMALQLKRQRPATRVLLVDKRTEPAPEATFKVGESSVENGAHYFREILGMKDHLEEHQLRKHGLRFFLPAGDNSDITRRVEVSTPADDAAWTHQIDRGRFENELFRRGANSGVDAYRGWRVLGVEMAAADAEHSIEVGHEDERATVTAHWIVDATGRANLLRKKLELGTETGHHVNASWFRLAGGLNFEDWTDDEEWLGRMKERGIRQYSTTHLVGAGYWVWLIALKSGPISIGICADPRIHPFERINSFDALVEWFQEFEPQLGAEVDGRRDDVMDFLRIEDFSYASSQIFSAPGRWTLSGEAAGFVDALYSPGSDFIAYTNSFGGDLICRELDGESQENLEEREEFYNFFFFRLFDPTVELYKDQYQFFGNPQVMTAKVLYDCLAYASTLGFLFTHGKMTQLEDLGDIIDIFQTIIPLLGRMQVVYRDWHALDQRQWEGVSALSYKLEPFMRAQHEIGVPFETDEMVERAKEKVEAMKAVAVWTFHKAAKLLPEPPDETRPIDPLAISLRPDQWEQDGLFSDDGMTLAQALELLPGIEEFDLEASGAVIAQ